MADDTVNVTNVFIEPPETCVLWTRPGDTFVLECPTRISNDVAKRLHRQFREHFPEHKLLILEAGLKLSVITAAEEEPLAEGWPK